jgi:hypothetical protein
VYGSRRGNVFCPETRATACLTAFGFVHRSGCPAIIRAASVETSKAVRDQVDHV